MNGNVLPKVSVIIPVLNGINYVTKCLDCITHQDYPKDKYEVIIVDNGSTDGTIEVVRTYNVKLEHCHIKGPAAARNLGALNATGDILLFIDIDCLGDPALITTHVKGLLEIRKKYPDVISIAGGIAGYITNFWTLFDDFCSWAKHHPNLKSKFVKKYWPTANLSITKSAFNEVGKFNKQLLCAEDVDFCKRILKKGYRIYFEPSAVVKHMNRDNLHDISTRIKNWSRFNTIHIESESIVRYPVPGLLAVGYFFMNLFIILYNAFLAKRFYVIFFIPFLLFNSYMFTHNWLKLQLQIRSKKVKNGHNKYQATNTENNLQYEK